MKGELLTPYYRDGASSYRLFRRQLRAALKAIRDHDTTLSVTIKQVKVDYFRWSLLEEKDP